MKIYTKKGDKGETFLANGSRVYKYDLRVELYGMCDELNSYIGIVNALITEKYQLNAELNHLFNEFLKIQNLLFELGAELAGYYKDNNSILKEEDITFLELSIDKMNEKLPELRSFILPGGSMISAFLHLCRTYCRNLERKLVYAIVEEKLLINELMISFFNRLSDYFFIASRYTNYIIGYKEIEWKSIRKNINKK
jgi:cob(I)alamin adenosyltransferase